MVKLYILAGALLFTSLVVYGGVSLNTQSGDQITEQAIYLPAKQSDSSFYNLFSAAEAAPKPDKKEGAPVPLPYWVLQKLMSKEEVTTSPIPCPVWMLYQLGTS